MAGFFTSPGFRGALHTTLFASVLHPIVVTFLRSQDDSAGFSWATVKDVAWTQTPTYAVVLFIIMAGWAGFKYRRAQHDKNAPETE